MRRICSPSGRTAFSHWKKLDEAAESGRSYRVRIDRAAGKAEEEVGGDVPEGVSVALLDQESGEILCEKRF